MQGVLIVSHTRTDTHTHTHTRTPKEARIKKKRHSQGTDVQQRQKNGPQSTKRVVSHGVMECAGSGIHYAPAAFSHSRSAPFAAAAAAALCCSSGHCDTHLFISVLRPTSCTTGGHRVAEDALFLSLSLSLQSLGKVNIVVFVPSGRKRASTEIGVRPGHRFRIQ